jgi:hypothetical protein
VHNPGARRAQRAAHVTVDAFEQLAKATAARFIVRGGDEWPAGLDDLRPTRSWRDKSAQGSRGRSRNGASMASRFLLVRLWGGMSPRV